MELSVTQLYYNWPPYLFLALLIHVLVRAMSRAGKEPGRPRMMPPGPWQLPLIGSIHHLLRGLPHHTMRDLSDRHGPVMLLRVCELVVVVVSSPEAAREVFKRHGTAFEQRPSSPGLDELHAGHGQGVVLSPYGEHWRLLRRILMTELLSQRCVEAFRHIRQDEAARLVSAVFIAGSSVRSIVGGSLPDQAAFLSMMKHATELSSVFDLRDLFPSSRFVRMLPRSGKAMRHLQEVFRVFDAILRRHEERKAVGDGDGEQGMVDVLLKVQKEGNMRVALTPGVVKSMVMDVFGAAVDTQTITLQWAMAELMANPRMMEKAQREIRHVLAGQESVQEAALRDLRYLKAVIKETSNRKVQGYDLPKGTILVTNAWAISRDPKHWEDPESFVPQRFQGERDLDLGGSNFSFMPFGSGRRICPGIDFAQANIEIALASLLYHFDWELPPGVKEEDIDMAEVFGITVKRKADLVLRPVPRIPVVYDEHSTYS
ncbi:hypothetical protein BS78_K311600 [Paspalum vaginatum]|uniref:Cytochrome P450 n=1 Tax=Paspalum vaginatum TaxID=158149 RepID=A0A9W8CGI3_9POAL|nr:hypothetical protein BS78_K311600 [Paspalum vaginatum]